MANSKISALTSASTPLTGTETLPVVQSSATTQVTVANLTAGRAVSGLSFAAATLGAPSSTTLSIQATGTTYVTVLGAGTNNGYVGIGTATPGYLCDVNGGDFRVTRGSGDGFIWIGNQTSSYYISGGTSSNTLYAVVAGSTAFSISSARNLTFFGGNLTQGTAAKGVNFTANTPAAGMTSQLLNWYEEGTWTPAYDTFAGAFTVLTYTTQQGTYVRMGRTVICQFFITVLAVTTGTAVTLLLLKGFPFAFNTGANAAAQANGYINFYTGWTTNAPTLINYAGLSDKLGLLYSGATTISNTPPANVTAACQLRGTVIYQI